jgi:hypothetical protein
MSIVCFGLSHQTAAVDMREKFAIPESALPEALGRLKARPGLIERLIVSTCCRTEFYVTGQFLDGSAQAFFDVILGAGQTGEKTAKSNLPNAICRTEAIAIASHRGLINIR